MKKISPKKALPTALSAALACLGINPFLATHAQPAPAIELPTVTVTEKAFGQGEAAVPALVLTGDALSTQKESTLGQTLQRELGVSTTGFGANASRPIIRGLDGDRIKLLSNGASNHDVSSLSFDHVSPFDPLVAERIEVLRGPATLLYGGGAVGGVVNTIDNRIPTAPLQGLSGVVDASIDTSQRGRSGSAVLETSLGKDWALHVDAFKRRSESTSVPVALDCSLNGLAVTQKKVCNTQAQADGGAVGVSRLWSTGFVGLSVDTYRSDYGTPAEDEVTLAMKRTSYTLKGEQRQMSGPFKAIAVHINSTRYAHTELDAGVPATEFNKRGQDAKLTLTHRDTTLAGLGLTGTALLSVDRERFSALGDEAFVPNSQQRQLAIASVQTLKTAWGSLTAGVRVESVNLSSKGGDQTDYSGANKFNVLERRFTPKNLALSSVINVFEKTQLTASVSSNERAPSASELFANGAHVATAAFEIGDANLSKEKSRNLDVGVQWRDGNSSFKLGGFYNRFKNYIGLNNSGTGIGADGNPSTLDADGDGIDDASGESILAQYQYQAVGARFMGLEAQGQMRLIKQPYTLDVTAKFDTLSAVNISNGEPLPRIAPMRLTLAALVKHKGWTWRAEWAHNAKQSKVPENDMQGATPAYNLINLRADYRNPKQANTLWYLSVDNVLNKVAYNAATIDTIRDKAPLAGRRLKLGVQIGF